MSRSLLWAPTLTCLLFWAGPACKVPLSDINAAFSIADTAWFAEEETLFVFYEVTAEQGLGPETVLEIRYLTDDGEVPWTPLADLAPVHTHVAVDCGVNARCGSTSLHVPREPREVAVRLRYHREGEVSLDAETLLNVVGPGPPHSHRSLLIYGVFDAQNRAVQWRARHRFPTIRNEEAQRLGLRRRIQVQAQRFGTVDLANPDNLYAYGMGCPAAFTALAFPRVDTEARAAFNPDDLPDAAASASTVCADSAVWDPTGPFVTTAFARKNPEVRPAFPLLRSPIRDATPIKYLLAECDRTISAEHVAMQRQRLFLGGLAPVCIDDWMSAGFVDALVARFAEDIERVRAEGEDMVLVLALHHDAPEVGPLIEEAIAHALATEQDRATPRVAGAFVLDSFDYRVTEPELAQSVIWCPATLPLEEIGIGGEEPDGGVLDDEADGGPKEPGEGFNLASLVCAVLPDNPTLSFGPFQFSTLPIFSSRSTYLEFIDTYSEDQAGRMKSLTFRVPELPPGASNVRIPPFGVATFFNDEVITADGDDAFSYCETEEYAGFVFRSAIIPDLLPLEVLPEWHAAVSEGTYELGIVWDFPYLLRLRYEAIVAGAVGAFSASLPFGIATQTEQNYGSTLWESDTFSLAQTMTQCLRFCDHPTFDAAGVYQVADAFRTAYASACYAPLFPQRGGTVFPHDP